MLKQIHHSDLPAPRPFLQKNGFRWLPILNCEPLPFCIFRIRSCRSVSLMDAKRKGRDIFIGFPHRKPILAGIRESFLGSRDLVTGAGLCCGAGVRGLGHAWPLAARASLHSKNLTISDLRLP